MYSRLILNSILDPIQNTKSITKCCFPWVLPIESVNCGRIQFPTDNFYRRRDMIDLWYIWCSFATTSCSKPRIHCELVAELSRYSYSSNTKGNFEFGLKLWRSNVERQLLTSYHFNNSWSKFASNKLLSMLIFFFFNKNYIGQNLPESTQKSVPFWARIEPTLEWTLSTATLQSIVDGKNFG